MVIILANAGKDIEGTREGYALLDQEIAGAGGLPAAPTGGTA